MGGLILLRLIMDDIRAERQNGALVLDAKVSVWGGGQSVPEFPLHPSLRPPRPLAQLPYFRFDAHFK